MRKIVWGLMIFGSILAPFVVLEAQAKEGEDKSAAAQSPEKKKAQNEAKRRAELENTEWKVTLYSNNPTDKDAEEGVLVFQNNTMSFKDFKKFNLEPIGYTLTAYPNNDKGTLETYKITKDGNISLRSDWEGQVMNGIIGQQSADGKSMKVLRFTSVNSVKPIAPPKKEAAQAAVAVSGSSPEKALVSEENDQSEEQGAEKSSKNGQAKASGKLAGKLVSL